MSRQSEYLRTSEVSRLLHVSPKTVSRWAQEKRLPFVMTLGGHRRFPADSIRELVVRMAEEGQLEGQMRSLTGA